MIALQANLEYGKTVFAKNWASHSSDVSRAARVIPDAVDRYIEPPPFLLALKKAVSYEQHNLSAQGRKQPLPS